MRRTAEENPNAQVFVMAIAFRAKAQWHVSKPTPVADFRWEDLIADGVTSMGAALSQVAAHLKALPERGLPPVLVLISDGLPTDDFAAGLKDLMAQPWGKKAVRISIAIGSDADHDTLQKFIGHNELKPLQANNPEALVKQIKWASTAVLKSASSPPSQGHGTTSSGVNVPIPAPPNTGQTNISADDVW